MRQLGVDIDIDVLDDLPRKLEPRPCLGYMEREPGRLQLGLEPRGDEHVDQIVVAEDDQAVVAFARRRGSASCAWRGILMPWPEHG